MTQDPLLLIALLACIVVLVILLLGMNSFRQTGVEARKQSNKFMRWRLIAQFVAVAIIALFVFIRGQSGG